MEKLFTKENIIIAVAVFSMIVQSNYFATKLDLANVKLEMTQMQAELHQYADNGDKEILHEIKSDIQMLSQKIGK